MGAPDNKIRATDDALKAVQDVCTRFPEWSQGQLVSKVLVELRDVVFGKTATMPTVDYLRGQLGYATPSLRVAEDSMMERLEAAVEKYARIREEAQTKKKAARGKHAA